MLQIDAATEALLHRSDLIEIHFFHSVELEGVILLAVESDSSWLRAIRNLGRVACVSGVPQVVELLGHLRQFLAEEVVLIVNHIILRQE